MYHYKATIIKVTDGDSFEASVDVGFGVALNEIGIRMMFMNAPDKKYDLIGFERSKKYLREWFDKNPVFEIRTRKNKRTAKDEREKWRRYLGEVFPVGGVESGAESINDEMVRLGYAVSYYDNRKPKTATT